MNSWWYKRSGGLRIGSATVALYVAITSLIRLLTQGDTSDVVLGMLGTVAGVALLVTVVLSMRFDRRARHTERLDGSVTPNSQ